MLGACAPEPARGDSGFWHWSLWSRTASPREASWGEGLVRVVRLHSQDRASPHPPGAGLCVELSGERRWRLPLPGHLGQTCPPGSPATDSALLSKLGKFSSVCLSPFNSVPNSKRNGHLCSHNSHQLGLLCPRGSSPAILGPGLSALLCVIRACSIQHLSSPTRRGQCPAHWTLRELPELLKMKFN